MLRTMLRCGIASTAMMVALGSCRFVLAEDHNHDHKADPKKGNADHRAEAED